MDYASSNIVRKALHSWVTPLLQRGRTGEFAVGDAIPLLSPQDGVRALVGMLSTKYNVEKELDAGAKRGSKRNGIWRALLAAHWPEMLLHAFWTSFEMGFRLAAPYALRRFVGWLRENDVSEVKPSESEGWKWATLFCVFSTCLAMAHHQLFWVGMRMGYGMKQQVLVSTL
jgi:hypothetical protein